MNTNTKRLIIGCIFVIILIAISSTVMYLGHDLIYHVNQVNQVNQLQDRTSNKPHNGHPIHGNRYRNDPDITNRLSHFNQGDFNQRVIDTETETDTDTSDTTDTTDTDTTDNDTDDTEPIQINNKEVGIKKSSIEQIYKDVKEELSKIPQPNDNENGNIYT